MPLGTIYPDLGNLLREDVLDIIAQITPLDTPFFNMIADSSANQPFHQWHRRNLTTRGVNAQVEGEAYGFTFAAITSTRELNVTQIFKKEVRISRTSQQSVRYAVADQFADQLSARLAEYKTDNEHALIRGTLVSGNASVGRSMRGLIWAITIGTNNTSQHASGGVSLSEAMFNDLLQNIWTNGVRARDVLVGGVLKRRISGFTASTTKFRDQHDLTLTNVVSVYESDFGVVEVHLSRDVPNTNLSLYVIAFDRDMFKKAWLDRPFTKRTADVADSMDGVIIGECTLEYGDPAGAGWFSGLS